MEGELFHKKLETFKTLTHLCELAILAVFYFFRVVKGIQILFASS